MYALHNTVGEMLLSLGGCLTIGVMKWPALDLEKLERGNPGLYTFECVHLVYTQRVLCMVVTLRPSASYVVRVCARACVQVG